MSHHGLSEAEFTRCIESGKDIDDYVREKKNRADRGQGKALAGGASEAEGRPSRYSLYLLYECRSTNTDG